MFLAYQKYADAMAREDYERAESPATGPARDATASLRQAAGGSPVNGLRPDPFNAGPLGQGDSGLRAFDQMGKTDGKKSPDGSRDELSVTETVCRTRPGVSSVLCKWPVEFRHDIEVHLEDGTWKVYSFREDEDHPVVWMIRLTPERSV